jgi:hypothetical protein
LNGFSRAARVQSCTLFLAACSVLPAYGAEQPTVQVEPAESGGACQIAPSTQTSVIRNYLQAWQSMATAFAENSPTGLGADFVGVAKQKLEAAIHQQEELGLKTRYADKAHDLKLFFCSPEGMSVELVDTVDYEISIQDQTQAPQHVRARYVAVLTPTETRWKVRVFQAEPKQ